MKTKHDNHEKQYMFENHSPTEYNPLRAIQCFPISPFLPLGFKRSVEGQRYMIVGGAQLSREKRNA